MKLRHYLSLRGLKRQCNEGWPNVTVKSFALQPASTVTPGNGANIRISGENLPTQYVPFKREMGT
jgi:hypothetical protein